MSSDAVEIGSFDPVIIDRVASVRQSLPDLGIVVTCDA